MPSTAPAASLHNPILTRVARSSSRARRSKKAVKLSIVRIRSLLKVHAVEDAGIDEALRRVAALPSDHRWAALDGLAAGSALIQFVNTLLALLREVPLGTHALRSDELLLLLNEATLPHHRLSLNYLRQREAATAIADVFMSNGMDASLSIQGYVASRHRLRPHLHRLCGWDGLTFGDVVIENHMVVPGFLAH